MRVVLYDMTDYLSLDMRALLRLRLQSRMLHLMYRELLPPVLLWIGLMAPFLLLRRLR